MSIIKNISAYYTGKVKCSNPKLKAIPSCVYSYNKEQTDWFVYGILKSSSSHWLDDEIHYIHPSFILLTMLQYILGFSGIKSRISYDSLCKSVVISKKDLIF